MTLPEINVGFIGYGRAAENIYVPLLKNFISVKVRAVVDVRKDRRELAARSLRECKIYESICTDFINDVDAAIILTPPNQHVPAAIELLKNQKYILVEKPLSLSLDGIDELLKYNALSNSKLAVGFNHRHWHPVKALKEVIQKKNVKIKSAEILFTSDYNKWNPICTQSNPMKDLAPHVFDLIRYIFNDEIVSIESNRNSETDYSFDATTSKDLSVRCRVAYSSSGVRILKIASENNEYIIRSGSERISPTSEKIRNILDFKDNLHRVLLGKSSSLKDSYKVQMEEFFKLKVNVKAKLADLSDGIENIKAILAANKSLSEKGRKIFLNEFE